MSILHRLFGVSREEPHASTFTDPDLELRRRVTEAKIERERQELRQKVERVQSASRVMGTMAGMMQMMTEADRGTDR